MPNNRKNNLTILIPIPFKTNNINGKFIPLHGRANIKIQQDSGKPLIQKRAGKKGKEAFEFEIKIYQHIKSNKESKEKAILLPEEIENLPYEPTLYFTALHCDLESCLHYFGELNKTDNSPTSWLMGQLLSLLDALDHLHTKILFLGRYGITHGDIKPDNILINGQGKLVLIDFECASSVAKPERRLGSVLYMAPEMFANIAFDQEAVSSMDKSDIWSLGITFYQLLMGKRPDFLINFASQGNFGPKFFQEKMGNKCNNCIKDDPLFLLHLTGWKKYHSESQATDSRDSLQILQKNKDKNVDRLTQWEFLKHGVMSMLAPLGERYKAKRLAELLQLFKKDFPQPNENDSQQFITDLLKASSQNVHEHSKPSFAQP